MGFNRTLKRIYKYLPFKKHLLHGVRFVGVPPKSIYKHLHFNGEFEVKLDSDHSFKMIHYGFEIENELFWKGVTGGWESVSLGLWTRLCRNARVIMDVGANTGVYSLIAKSLNPGATVIAYEPVERVFDKLKKNIYLNKFNIFTEKIALSNYNGVARIYDPGTEHVYSVTVNNNTYKDTVAVEEVEIPVLRADEYLKQHSLPMPDLIKLDVELHEAEVIEGFGDMIRQTKPTLIIEILTQELAEKLNETLAPADYLYFNIHENRGIRQQDKLSKSDYYNFLVCTRQVAQNLQLNPK